MGVSPSVYGGDSGDIILASWFGGVAHPPGYPLNTMIGWIFTHLPYPATVACKANLMASFFMAAAAAVVFLILKKLTQNVIISLASSFFLAFTTLFWLYAHVIEVFQLNLLLVAISVYFLISWRKSTLEKKAKPALLYFSFLFLGLAVFHHHTAALLGPSYLYLIHNTNKNLLKNFRNLVKLGLFFISGFLPYIFIPFAAARKTPINWDDPTNLHNFFRLITRADYGTFLSASDFLGLSLMERISQTLFYLLTIKADFSILGVLLVLVGFIWLYLKQKVTFWFIVIAIFFAGPFFFFYASFPISSDFLSGLWERFLLLSYFFLVIPFAFGLKYSLEVLTKILSNFHVFKKRTQTAALFFHLLSFFIPYYLFLNNGVKADLGNFYLGERLGQDILASAEPNSIVVIYADTAVFNSQYVFYTTENNKKIKLIKAGSLKHFDYRSQVAREYNDLVLPENFFEKKQLLAGEVLKNLTELNNDKFPIYMSAFWPEVEGYKWTSVGLLKKLAPNYIDNEGVLKLNAAIFREIMLNKSAFTPQYSHFIMNHIKNEYYVAIIRVVDELISYKYYDEAEKYLDFAIEILPNQKDAYVRRGIIKATLNQCSEAISLFERAYELDKKDWKVLYSISDIYKNCYKNLEKSNEFKIKAEELMRIVNKDYLDEF